MTSLMFSVEALFAVGTVALLIGVFVGAFLMHGMMPKPRCRAYPLDYVRCVRHRGHAGSHVVYPQDIRNAHYERTPF